jgi:hypothetical protein
MFSCFRVSGDPQKSRLFGCELRLFGCELRLFGCELRLFGCELRPLQNSLLWITFTM